MSGGFRTRYPSQDRALLSRRLLLSSIFPSHRFWLVALCVGAGVKIFRVTLKSPHFSTPAHKIPQSTSRDTRALMHFRAIASLHWLYSMKSNRFPSDTTWRLQRSVFVALALPVEDKVVIKKIDRSLFLIDVLLNLRTFKKSSY